MPTFELTDEEANVLIQMLINSNPIIVKLLKQMADQKVIQKVQTDGNRS